MKNFLRMGYVQFPRPSAIRINMMPYIVNDKKSIPLEYQHYWPLIEQCEATSAMDNHKGGVGYVTIDESIVQKGTAQRRPGIHIERTQYQHNWGGGSWGSGVISNGKPVDGLFMTSNISNSNRIWDVRAEKCDYGGDCEYMRSDLKNPYCPEKNELIWLTDTCPHEVIPLNRTQLRQWFRLVSPNVDTWNQKYCTSNRLGVESPNKKSIGFI